MNISTYNCWVCDQSSGPLMPLNQGGWQNGETFYIHTMCFLFFDHGDWTYDGHNYVMRNDQIFFAQTKSCFSCQTQQRQRLVKCHEISCQNYYHIGCIFKNQLIVYENKQHSYKMARLVIFCPHHVQYGLEKVRRDHIIQFNFQNLDSQIIAILNDHIAQKEKYGTNPPPQNWRHKKEKKSRRKEKKRSHSRQRSRSRSHRRKKSHRQSRDHKSRRDRNSKKHHRQSVSDEENLTFSSSGNEEPRKHKNQEDEFFKRIVGEEEGAAIRQRIFKPQPQIQQTQWMQQIQIKKKINFEKVEIEQPQSQQQPIAIKQQNSLEALAQQKRLSETTKKEQDIMMQKQLLEDLIKQQSTFYIDNVPKFTQPPQQTHIQLQRKQRLLPMNQKEILNMIEVLHGQVPLYPFNVSEAKRDVHMAAWWECLSMLFFQEVATINQNLLAHSDGLPESRRWYESHGDQELLLISQQPECFEPMIFTVMSMRDTVNVLYQCQQSKMFFRYQFDAASSEKKYDHQLKQSWPFEVHSKEGPLRNDGNSKYKDHYGQELTWMETLPLSPEEFQECIALESLIAQARHEDPLEELELCYGVLKNQLSELVQQNNQLKSHISLQIHLNPINIEKKIKEQNLLMDYLRWQQVVKSMKNGYADKTLDILSCFYRLPTSSAHKEKQKGLLKMQSLLSKSNEKPLDTDCKVCFDNETSEINPVIYCDKCQTSFHRLCYGIQGLILDHQDFLCDGCRSGVKAGKDKQPSIGKVACQICGKLGLPQKLIKNKFYHVACLILTNSIVYENGSLVLRQGVTSSSIQNMVDENEGTSNQCAICGKIRGFKLSCNNNSQGIPCRHTFHPMCAYLNGIKMDISVDEFRRGEFTHITVRITCALHAEQNLNNQILQVYYRRFGLNLDQTAKLGGFDRFEEIYKHQSGYMYIISSSQSKLPTIQNTQPQTQETTISDIASSGQSL